MDNLEEIIRTYIPLGNSTPSGWFPVRCLVCNDHPHKKRGGFRFDAGDKVAYHCFNCPAKAVYDPNSGNLSNAMRDILVAFGVPTDDISRILLHDMGVDKSHGKIDKPKKIDSIYFPKEIELPSFFTPLKLDKNNPFSLMAEDHLKTKRMMTLDDYSFFTGISDGTWESKEWVGRLIIPFYSQNKLVFYTGRDLTDNPKRTKYKHASISKTGVLYGYDEINRRTNEPLYVVEGFFDAFHINGVAVSGNEISEEQIKILNRSPRPKVIIPDRKGDGGLLAAAGLKQKWQVSIPEIGDCKDVCEAIQKYGKIYAMHSIIENTFSGMRAEVAVRLFCEKSEVKKPKKVVTKKLTY